MNNNNLKYVREELEMTQEELGLVFGVKGSTVAGWENNNDSIPLNFTLPGRRISPNFFSIASKSYIIYL